MVRRTRIAPITPAQIDPARIPIFAESQTIFFPKVVDAELEFAKNDDQGRPTEMILHQNGRDQTAKRVDDAEFKRIADSAAAVAKRFKDQKPMPGSDAALRKMIDDLRQGQPDYDRMSAGLAAATRQQLPQIQPMISQMGALQSLTFTGVGPGGADIYTVKFENGSLEYRIMLGTDGKIEGASVRPIQ